MKFRENFMHGDRAKERVNDFLTAGPNQGFVNFFHKPVSGAQLSRGSATKAAALAPPPTVVPRKKAFGSLAIHTKYII